MSKVIQDGNSRVMWLGLLAVTLICTFVIVSSYRTQIEIYEDKELVKLLGIANTLVMQLDGDEHVQLTKQYPSMDGISSSTQDVHYKVIHDILKGAKERNKMAQPIYTMMYNNVEGEFRFAVTSNDEPYWMHSYEHFPQELIENYEEGGALPPYEDENGHWLSAYAPIKDRNNNTVALLQVDTQFDAFLMMAQKAAWKNIFFSFLVIALLSTVMLILIRSTLLKQRNLELERAGIEQQRRELTANISHDLRTPLSSIHGYVETIILKKATLGEEREMRYLKTALHNTNKLKTLVDQLFELSRLESAEKKLTLEPFNIVELLYDTISSLTIQAKGRKMHLEMEAPSMEVPMVMGDLAEIDRVVQNLIGNSLEHGSEGQTISLKLEHRGSKVRVSISDNGPGIRSSQLPHVFDRFSSMKQDTNGSGLGLAIVKRVLDLHHSPYKLESMEGHGTTFWFDLASA